MGGTTTNGLPYPVGTDRVMDGDNAIQALAEAIDLKTLFSGDSGTLTPAAAGFTTAAGASGLTGSVRKRNGIVAVDLIFTAVSGWAAGDVANTNLILIPAGWQPLIRTNIPGAANGPGAFFYASGGAISVGSSSGAVAAGTTQQMAGNWMA